MGKKIGIGLGIIFLVLILVLGAIPFFVNVDDYRPKMVETANSYLNGHLELGKLHLSLWGKVSVGVEGLTLTDAKGRKVVSVENAGFQMPFLSILTGSPLLTLRMERPELNVIKDKNGKMNVLSLLKSAESPKAPSPAEAVKSPPSTSSPAPVAPSPAPTAKSQGSSSSLPAILLHARLGVEMLGAVLFFHDESTGLVSQVQQLDVHVKDLSLGRATDIEITANLGSKMGQVFDLKGPLLITAHLNPTLKGGEFEKAEADVNFSLDEVEISAGDMFLKSARVPAHIAGKIILTPDAIDMQGLKARFHTAEIQMTGGVSGLKSETGPVLGLEISSNEINLKGWSEVIPMLKEYELKGTAKLGAKLSGLSANPQVKADVSVTGLTAKAPNLKAEPRFDVELHVLPDRIEKMVLTMKAPGTDLKIHGSLNSFIRPHLEVSVTSSGMDLDQLVDPSKTATASAKAKEEKAPEAKPQETKHSVAKATEAKGNKTAKAEDFDALIDPLRKNEIARLASGSIKVAIESFKSGGVKMAPLNAQMSVRDLQFSIDSFQTSVFGAKVAAKADLKLAPKSPEYHFSTSIEGLDLQQAVASQMELFKNTLLGIVTAKLEGNGSSFNPEPAKKNLNAKGNFLAKNASLATIDIGKMVTDGLTKSLSSLTDKIPGMKGKSFAPNLNIESKFSSISSSFTINQGRFRAPDFVAKAEAGKGVDLKGDTEVGLIDYSLRADWEVTDPYNLTHAKDLSVDQAGVHVDHILVDGNNPLKIPIKVGGTLLKPDYNYSEIAGTLSKVALNNVAHAAGNKVKDEITKKAKDQLGDTLKKFGGGLFPH